MLITNQSTYMFGSAMENLKDTIPTARKNVARKSTSNRPLKTVDRSPITKVDNSALILGLDNTESCNSNYLTNLDSEYVKYKRPIYSAVSNFSTLSGKVNFDSTFSSNKTSLLQESLNSLEETEEDCDNIDGVFSISSSMLKYLKESQLSPQGLDDSDESFDGNGVLNYPIEFEYQRFVEKEFVPCYADEFPSDNESDMSENDKIVDVKSNVAKQLIKGSPVEPVSGKLPIIKSEICSDSTSDDKVDLNNCRKSVRPISGGVIVSENKCSKMTIINTDELPVSEDNCPVLETTEDSLKIEFITTLVNNDLWEDTGNFVKYNNKEVETVLEKEKNLPPISAGKVQKRKCKTKQVFSYKKRKTRSSKKNVISKLIENIGDKAVACNGKATTKVGKNIKETTKSKASPKSKKKLVAKSKGRQKIIISDESPEPDLSLAIRPIEIKENELHSENSKAELDIDKSKNQDCKKSEKKKNEINEGVLLHVEAAKKTNIMRDGKLLKDKKELLKDIESKIESNQPIVVDKEFDIQQSLTEEILLDQALRLAHQRTSPRRKPLLTTSQAKEIIKSLTSRNTRSKSTENKNTNSVDSHIQQKSTSDGDISDAESTKESESSDNGKQNSDDHDSANTVQNETSGKKLGVKKYSKTRNSKSLKRILRNVVGKNFDMDELSRTCSEVLKSMSDIGNPGNADQSESDSPENKKEKSGKKKLCKRKTVSDTLPNPDGQSLSEELVPVIIIKNKNEAFLRRRSQRISKIAFGNNPEENSVENTIITPSSEEGKCNNEVDVADDRSCVTSSENLENIPTSNEEDINRENFENIDVNLINLDATCATLVIDDSILNDSLAKPSGRESLISFKALSPIKEISCSENKSETDSIKKPEPDSQKKSELNSEKKSELDPQRKLMPDSQYKSEPNSEEKSEVSSTTDTPLVLNDSPESPDNDKNTLYDDVIEITDMEVDSPQRLVNDGNKQNIVEYQIIPEKSKDNSRIPFLDGSDRSKTGIKDSCSDSAVMSIINKFDNDNADSRQFTLNNQLSNNEAILNTVSNNECVSIPKISTVSSSVSNYYTLSHDQNKLLSDAAAAVKSLYGISTFQPMSTLNSFYPQQQISGNTSSSSLLNSLNITGNNRKPCATDLSLSIMSAGTKSVSHASLNSNDIGVSGSLQETSQIDPNSLYPATYPLSTCCNPPFTSSAIISNPLVCTNGTNIVTTSEVSSFIPTYASHQNSSHNVSPVGTPFVSAAAYSSAIQLQQVSKQNIISQGGTTFPLLTNISGQVTAYVDKNVSNSQYPSQTSVEYSSPSDITPNNAYNTQICSTSSQSNEVKMHDRILVTKEEPKSKAKIVDVPLSILARDPRLRRKHVRVILEDVEYNASAPALNSVNPTNTVPALIPVTALPEPLRSNFEDDSNSKDNDDDLEPNLPEEETGNDSEMNKLDSDSFPSTYKKKSKKKEVDKELLYKTPLCDLHDETSDRSSYSRKPRKPLRFENAREQEPDNKAERLPSFHIHHEPYREYNTDSNSPHNYNQASNTLYHEEDIISEYPPTYSTNSRRLNTERVNDNYRYDELPQHSRKPDHFVRRRPEEYIEGRRGREYPDRRPLLEHPFCRSNQRYQDYRTESHSKFHTDYRHQRRSDYSRWDYAHKKMDGKFPVNSELTEYNSRAWKEDSEVRDLLEGPVHSVGGHPYSRRRGGNYYKMNYPRDGEASDGELFERRWEGSEDEWRYRRPYRDRSPLYEHKRVDRPHGPGRGPEPSTLPLDSPMSPDEEFIAHSEPVKYLSIPQ